MFASKAQPDRFPFRVGAVRLAYEGTLDGKHTVYDPRPFDPAMHNRPSGILLEFRALRERTGNPTYTDAYMFSSDLLEDFGRYDPDEWNHAMDVLNRLTRVSLLAKLAS